MAFAMIPPEIEEAIWKLTLNEHRIIFLEFDDFQYRSTTRVPAVLHVNRFSRSVGLKHYKLLFELGTPEQKNTYFSNMTDAFYLMCTTAIPDGERMLPGLAILSDGLGPEEKGVNSPEIETVMIDWNYLRLSGQDEYAMSEGMYWARCFSYCRSIRKLGFVIDGDIGARRRENYKGLTIENVEMATMSRDSVQSTSDPKFQMKLWYFTQGGTAPIGTQAGSKFTFESLFAEEMVASSAKYNWLNSYKGPLPKGPLPRVSLYRWEE